MVKQKAARFDRLRILASDAHAGAACSATKTSAAACTTRNEYRLAVNRNRKCAALKKRPSMHSPWRKSTREISGGRELESRL